jgi:hypothetical protein
MQQLDSVLQQLPGAPNVFLEYAAGLELDWFLEVSDRLREAEHVSFCIDVGHIGIRQACASFARRHPTLDLRSMTASDERLYSLASEIQDAVASALPDVLTTTQTIGRLGKHVHFHLHDGHPLFQDLPDHFSFLTRLPIPFTYAGRQSLNTLYGPVGLAAIVATAIDACGLDRLSFTIEVHQVEGCMPLNDAAGIFQHWVDTTNAERTNHWLAVLAQNAMLVDGAMLEAINPPVEY